jgi:hypothetical protein
MEFRVVTHLENSLFKNSVRVSLSKAGYMQALRVRQAHPDIFLKLIHY